MNACDPPSPSGGTTTPSRPLPMNGDGERPGSLVERTNAESPVGPGAVTCAPRPAGESARPIQSLAWAAVGRTAQPAANLIAALLTAATPSVRGRSRS